jgi:hypothetical protein
MRWSIFSHALDIASTWLGAQRMEWMLAVMLGGRSNRWRAQNAACDSCHGNETLFLTEDDVDPDELEANRDVIVREVP